MYDKVEKVFNAIELGKRFTVGALKVSPEGDVYSYNVCIYRNATRTLHAKKYSQTTSCHQGIVRRALARAGIDFTESEDCLGFLDKKQG